MASAELESKLAGADGTAELSARELSGILKDMTALAKELRLSENRSVKVSFAPDAARLASTSLAILAKSAE